MSRLKDRTALVTGASRGIGRAIALELAREGARVAISYHKNEEKAQEVADEISKMGSLALMIRADVSDPQDAREATERAADVFGQLDILVNNAGITRDTSLKKMTVEQWDEVIQTNLGGYFYCTSAVIPIMIKQKYGRIINISSMNGQIGAFGQANYSASKGGIIAFTKTAALELAKFGVTVNGVSPGFTKTDMFAEVPDNIREQIVNRIPLKRFAKPEEIAKAVLFLVVDGDYITGQQINVNGGAFM